MKKMIYIVMVLFAVSLVSCTKELIPPKIAIQVNGQAVESTVLAKDSSLVMTAHVEGLTDYACVWTSMSSQISTVPECTFVAKKTGKQTVSLTVVTSDGVTASTRIIVDVYDNADVRILLDGKDAENQTVHFLEFKPMKLTSEVLPEGEYRYSWKVNGSEVATAASYEFDTDKSGEYNIALEVTNQYGNVYTDSFAVNVFDFTSGTFVLNEGNMSNETGTLIYISDDNKTMIDSVYIKVNGTTLGNVTQDMFIADGKAYFISQNGRSSFEKSDGMLIVADAATMKKVAAYEDELNTVLDWPSHIAVIGDNAYIRDNSGVYLFNLTTKALDLIEGSKGASKNRMVVMGTKVFVPASGKQVYVFENGALVQKIAMPGNVSGVVKSDAQHLLVSCTSNPAQIVKVKAADGSIVKANELPSGFKVGAGWGATPGISAKGDTVYFSNAGTKINRHIFSSNTTESVTDVKEHVADANIVYNNLGVHPVTGRVYFNTIKGYGMNYQVNDISVFNFSSAPVMEADFKNQTSFPAGIFFTASFK